MGRKGVGLVRLIDADPLEENLTLLAKYEDDFRANVILGVVETVRFAKTIDAVPVDKMELQQFSIDTQTRTAKAVFRFGDKRITLCRDCGELAPVVRCRECAYSKELMEDYLCWEFDATVKEDDYCSRGVRKHG